MPRTLVVLGFLRLTGAMTWDNGAPYVEELAAGMFGFVPPEGGWMVNNCGVVIDSVRRRPCWSTPPSTEKRNRALLAEVAELTRCADARSSTPTTTPTTPTATGSYRRHDDIGHHLCREGVLRAGLKATEVYRADYGDLACGLPDVTFAERHDLAPRRLPRRAAAVGGPLTPRNDVVVWLPEQKVFFAGHLAFAGGTRSSSRARLPASGRR